ncbi:hypothetical protein [Lysobacter sp. ESA13C]|uniref:hypothetical protein n=1 Tax=Lysobacter sp. ESA13C TaxID=2862676 RepID=UPI001CBCE05D|nr:hypothetical protein [Lysobacter sp. ESA13C]
MFIFLSGDHKFLLRRSGIANSRRPSPFQEELRKTGAFVDRRGCHATFGYGRRPSVLTVARRAPRRFGILAGRRRIRCTRGVGDATPPVLVERPGTAAIAVSSPMTGSRRGLMLKRTTTKLFAICAFCFGMAFSLSAIGSGGCQSCWDACQAEFDYCIDAGYPAQNCQITWRSCGISCGCPIP